MATSKKDLIRHFKIEALCGCTSKSLIRRFKKEYKLNDDQIEWLVEACNFNPTPNKIDYEKFYNCDIIKKAVPIDNPHVQLYCLPEFISPLDRDLLIGYINQKAVTAKLIKDEKEDIETISEHRTSSETTLSRFIHSYFSYIDDQFVKLMNLSPFAGEVIHGQKYEIG